MGAGEICYNVGKIVVNGLLDAHEDGHIDNEEIVGIINDCAKKMGLSVRLIQVGVDNTTLNEKLHEVKKIDENIHNNMKKTNEIVQQQLHLERRAYSARKSLKQALSETEITGIPDGNPERRKQTRLLISFDKTDPSLHQAVKNEMMHEDMQRDMELPNEKISGETVKTPTAYGVLKDPS